MAIPDRKQRHRTGKIHLVFPSQPAKKKKSEQNAQFLQISDQHFSSKSKQNRCKQKLRITSYLVQGIAPVTPVLISVSVSKPQSLLVQRKYQKVIR